MEQQTAVEWLEQQFKDTYDKEGKFSIAYTLNLVKQAKQMEKREAILLLNWILKHYETHTDSNYMFCWKSPSGQELDSVDLVEQYYNETYGK